VVDEAASKKSAFGCGKSLPYPFPAREKISSKLCFDFTRVSRFHRAAGSISLKKAPYGVLFLLPFIES